MKPGIRHLADHEEYWFVEGCFITELSNTAEDPGVSIARARVEPGVTTRRHRLDGITERYVIIEGTGRVELDGLAAQQVTAGDVVMIPPGTAQRITNTGDADLLFLAICSPRFVPEAYHNL